MFTQKIALVGAALVLATTFGAPSYADDSSKTRTYNLTFDGFCDGMNLTISNTVYVVGQSTGCSAGKVDEGFTAKRGKFRYLDVSSNDNGDNLPLTFVFDDPKGGSGHGWCVSNTTDGVTQNVINCGSYTINGPAHRGPYPSSSYSR
jgi:hypothetical protein